MGKICWGPCLEPFCLENAAKRQKMWIWICPMSENDRKLHSELKHSDTLSQAVPMILSVSDDASCYMILIHRYPVDEASVIALNAVRENCAGLDEVITFKPFHLSNLVLNDVVLKDSQFWTGRRDGIFLFSQNYHYDNMLIAANSTVSTCLLSIMLVALSRVLSFSNVIFCLQVYLFSSFLFTTPPRSFDTWHLSRYVPGLLYFIWSKSLFCLAGGSSKHISFLTTNKIATNNRYAHCQGESGIVEIKQLFVLKSRFLTISLWPDSSHVSRSFMAKL